MQTNKYGFSLIELMIVVSIIGILTMIALPSYQSYITRARFAEVIFATEVYKTAVTLALQEGTLLKDINMGANGIPPKPKPTKNLALVNVAQGVITATATALAGSATIILKPNEDGSIWSLGGTCVKLGLCHE